MSKSNFFSRPNPWGLSPDQLEAELKAEFERLAEERRIANEHAGWIFARNLAISDAEERGKEWVEPLDI